MNHIIITGASRGLGEAITRKLLVPENHLFCISRKKNEELITKANKNEVSLDYYEFDLGSLENIENVMNNIFQKLDDTKVHSIALVNNAGVVKPIKPLEKCESDEIINNINVNLLAPMLLTSLFIRYTEGFKVDKRVINISSGAGKKPYYGWSCYCTSKAGLDLFTRCVGVEQQNKDYPVKILSIAPGIVDTDMQKDIRASNKEDFVDLKRFISYKEEGMLMSPEFVAEKIVRFLEEDFEQGGVIDIRDLQ
ncbi:(S)-benzoin forming benzil reductase [Microaerobacter geothermalis]|uniref:(S)-benzoin forming benzil reductase n=1 Tax=Microaerobacter geothermalis TaxID=674972 RepID=UPI001F29438E|nr:(S)-benzoin forming benzil reductase [Microaerobacter geothermalis]MCF6094356.1 (S)-benzoin forming benzil reductase [Microaerobacter geothermalis]